MHRAFILIFISFFSLIISGQQLQSFKDEKTNKYGFKDANGKVIVTPKYDTIKPFKDDVAVVGKKVDCCDYEYGLINKAGKEVVPLVYETAYIDAGIVVVQSDDKYGFIDKAGKKLTPLKYNNVWGFSDGIAGVELYDRDKGIGKWGFVDNTGKVVIPIKYDMILSHKKGVIAQREGKYFAVAKSGKETPLYYEKIGHAAYGLLLVKANNKYGFLNTKGVEVIPLKYDNAWDFSEWQRTGFLSNVRLNNKSGFIDTTGKEAISIKYDWVMLFREGLAPVRMDGPKGIAADAKWGYVDSTGNLVIQMNYNVAEYFSEGLAPVSKSIGKKDYNYGYIDMTGKEVIPFDFESADEFSGGLAAVKKEGKYGFIDRSGKTVIPFVYESVLSGFDSKKAKVVLNGKSITIDKTGKSN